MISKTIRCPNCQNTVKISGNPGERVIITCPRCNSKGAFTFPQIKKPILNVQDPNFSIVVNNLTKIYNGAKAVNNVSFRVRKGEIFGFLGPNGAGKTTTIKSIIGLIHVNSGNITINGFNINFSPKFAKKYIGYVPEKVAFYDNLTALQNMYFYAEMKGVSKSECKPLIEEFGLAGAMNKKVGAFSKGMTQRLGMARAILGSPPILILDEPSGGLDPRGVKFVRDKILELNQKGTTIFVSSHILSEVQALCHRVGIINQGFLVAEDSVSNLRYKLNLKPKILFILDDINENIKKAVENLEGVESVSISGRTLEVLCDPRIKAKIVVTINNAGGNIINLQTEEPSLEEVFMRYTEESK